MPDLESFLTSAYDYLSSDEALDVFAALAKIVVGFLVARFASRGLVRAVTKPSDAHLALLVRRLSFYTIFGLFLAEALISLGFNFGVLLGAAGILTVALGFASQTSASNIISGLFLLSERPFSIGDVIRLDTLTGEVLSIDLLSAKIRTFDNLYVRVPNETLIKSQIINLSRFPIRRVDLQIGVAYKEKIDHVRDVLRSVAEHNPMCLQEPEPLFLFLGYGESALNFQFSVWGRSENFITLRNDMYTQIKDAFDEHGIEIPFPHRTLYAGAVTEPFPVTVVNPPGTAPPGAPPPAAS